MRIRPAFCNLSQGMRLELCSLSVSNTTSPGIEIEAESDGIDCMRCVEREQNLFFASGVDKVRNLQA